VGVMHVWSLFFNFICYQLKHLPLTYFSILFKKETTIVSVEIWKHFNPMGQGRWFFKVYTISKFNMVFRDGNRPGFDRPEPGLWIFFQAWAWPMAFHRPIFLAWPGLFKSLAWPASLFTGLLHINLLKIQFCLLLNRPNWP